MLLPTKSDRELMQTKGVLAKALNFAVTPEDIPVAESITATETTITKNNLPEAEAERIKLKISAATNITFQERWALACLGKDEAITIFPVDKRRCAIVHNSTDYDAKMLDFLVSQICTILGTNTYEKLKRDPNSSCKKNLIVLQKMEKEQAIDRPQYY